jgi:hypothetical protein
MKHLHLADKHGINLFMAEEYVLWCASERHKYNILLDICSQLEGNLIIACSGR